MRNPIGHLRPVIEGLRTDLLDRELWCLCAIGLLLWLAN